MIAAFSTSGPRASVAVIDSGRLLFTSDEPAHGHASEVCLGLFDKGLQTLGLDLSDMVLFAADLGPGSFTGVRVGIVLAKTLAWTQGVPCMGADAFDLVATDRLVSLPSRRGEWFVRIPGHAPERTRLEPDLVDVPLASGFVGLSPQPVPPELLVPSYLMEPSISKPKTPFARP